MAICQWPNFVKFMKDEDFWSRWTVYADDHETYFFEMQAAIAAGTVMPCFDFSKTEVRLVAIDEALCWEHDGETLEYFFRKWIQGVRV